MRHHSRRFWNNLQEYHNLVELFERNMEITHPDFVTSDRLAPYSVYGFWNTTAVNYYEYRGPQI